MDLSCSTFQIGLALSIRVILKLLLSDYSLNCTPHGQITITNNTNNNDNDSIFINVIIIVTIIIIIMACQNLGPMIFIIIYPYLTHFT